MKKLICILSLLIYSTSVYGQSSTVNAGATLPSTCIINSVYITTSNPALNVCSSANTWTAFSFIPSGTISLINTGTCPTGWTESSALNGKMLRGTVAANSNVGQSGGNDTITPTVAALTSAAQIFTGNSVTSSAVSGGTPSGTNAATVTSGNCAVTNLAIGTGVATACKATAPNLTVPAETFTGSALSTHTHTTTATGTNTTSSVTGTLNSFDNRPAYTNVIFCSKN